MQTCKMVKCFLYNSFLW